MLPRSLFTNHSVWDIECNKISHNNKIFKKLKIISSLKHGDLYSKWCDARPVVASEAAPTQTLLYDAWTVKLKRTVWLCCCMIVFMGIVWLSE